MIKDSFEMEFFLGPTLVVWNKFLNTKSISRVTYKK